VTFLFPVIAILIGYLFGAIPVGYLVARLYGTDVTKVGSGRIGGTNVLRAAGPVAAGLTVLGDILKGLLPVYFVAFFGQPWVTALVGSATVLGHNYSIFLNFKGGVGAGTAMGAVAGLSLPVAAIAGLGGLIALAISRYASVLSTTIAILSLIGLIVTAWLGYIPYPYITTGVLNLLLMLNALRPNFARLRAGTERRIGQKTQEANSQ
jgi:glycerol-3-phosphate acyltransferase PlsY